MAEDWYADVNKHAPGADDTVVRKIVTHCGIALRNRDSSLVSFADPTEVGRIRERFLRRKLALTDGDDVLDRGINAVRDHMAGDRTKNRVTVYYLLADWFGRHDLFGGSASDSGRFSFAQSIGSATTTSKRPRKAAAVASKAAARPVAKSAPAPVVGQPMPSRANSSSPVVSPTSTRQSLYSPPEGSAARPMYLGYDDESGRAVWPHWFAIVAFLIAIVGALLLIRPS